MTVFVSASELNERIRSGQKQTILAVLWEPVEGKAWSKFQSEHIPTAMFCDPAVTLAGMPGRESGRNPHPTLESLEQFLAEWGIEQGRPVYIYDTGAGVFSARAWWTLRWMGVEDASYTARPGSLPMVEIDQVRDFAGLLIDARDAARYEGRRELLDLKAGHIPGALNLPVGDLLDEQTRQVVGIDTIRDRFAQLGVTQNTAPEDVVVYSGSGNHSALLIAAMAHAGLPVASHYVAGWSQWSGDPTNPVARNL
ncbi:rhodanese-like domain-containing protein [Corynebacterium sanguinis]|uniref:sulfurtransferase n=1 Tax=Corynebacterium sanguinis TaxID=2594913 RepID=UPI0021A65593|nr:rhodanese-like domain-containing protein [Corynebacterium sanguinis]MCT1443687.1 rhodanese-like domain-containing protein [Corynebacterium sanguinis]